jgi:hypothetical protein
MRDRDRGEASQSKSIGECIRTRTSRDKHITAPVNGNNGLRPPPGLRIRTATASAGYARRCSSSRHPAAMVSRARPVARETAVTPPQPKAEASAAAHCRRMRSSITGDSARYFYRMHSIVFESRMRPRSLHAQNPERLICIGYFFATPNQ